MHADYQKNVIWIIFFYSPHKAQRTKKNEQRKIRRHTKNVRTFPFAIVRFFLSIYTFDSFVSVLWPKKRAAVIYILSYIGFVFCSMPLLCYCRHDVLGLFFCVTFLIMQLETMGANGVGRNTQTNTTMTTKSNNKGAYNWIWIDYMAFVDANLSVGWYVLVNILVVVWSPG